jgi:hypothetical protein
VTDPVIPDLHLGLGRRVLSRSSYDTPRSIRQQVGRGDGAEAVPRPSGGPECLVAAQLAVPRSKRSVVTFALPGARMQPGAWLGRSWSGVSVGLLRLSILASSGAVRSEMGYRRSTVGPSRLRPRLLASGDVTVCLNC